MSNGKNKKESFYLLREKECELMLYTYDGYNRCKKLHFLRKEITIQSNFWKIVLLPYYIIIIQN